MKTSFLHGLTAGILASLAAIVYREVYHYVLVVDFSPVVSIGKLVAANVFVCMAVALLYFGARKVVKNHTDVWFHVFITVLTFASFLIPMRAKLPLDVAFPELYLGLAIPLHLFPQLFWVTSKVLFPHQPLVHGPVGVAPSPCPLASIGLGVIKRNTSLYSLLREHAFSHDTGSP